MNFKIFNNRRFKHGSLATIIAVGFIVVIVVINVIATMLLDRYPLTIDLTKDNRFALTQESIDYVKELKDDVKITICSDEMSFKGANQVYKQAYEIITSYSKYNNKIKVEFVDLLKNPTFSQNYPEFTIQQDDIIIESSLRSKKTSVADFFIEEQTEAGGYKFSSQAEQTMTSALMYVNDKNPITVTLLSGQNNVDVSGYTALLEKNNYKIETKNLLTEDISPESAFVILPAPGSDLTVEQVKKLETYLDNDGNYGKSLIYFSSNDRPVQPLLKGFLAEWGIEITPDVIFDTNNANVIYDGFTIKNNVVDEVVGKQLKTTKLPLIVPYSNAVNTLFEAKDNRKTKVITATSDSAILVPVEVPEDFNPANEEHKSFNTMVQGTREKYVGMESKVSSVLAVGSGYLANEAFLQNASYINSDVMITTTNTLTNKEDTFKIIPVSLNEETLGITKESAQIYGIVLMMVIPALILIAAIVTWVRRRHL